MEGPELMAYDAQDDLNDMDDTPSEAAGNKKQVIPSFNPSCQTHEISDRT